MELTEKRQNDEHKYNEDFFQGRDRDKGIRSVAIPALPITFAGQETRANSVGNQLIRTKAPTSPTKANFTSQKMLKENDILLRHTF